METKELLQRITSIKGRLAEVRKPAPDQSPSLETISEPANVEEKTLQEVLPPRLIPRGGLLLRRGQELLKTLRCLADDPLLIARKRESKEDFLARMHWETVAMLETVLRMVQAFPEAPRAQVRLCDGLETVLDVVEERTEKMQASLGLRQEESNRILKLASLLQTLSDGHTINLQAFQSLAQALAEEAKEGYPLRLLRAESEKAGPHIAAHSLNVAQVLARVLRDDPEWKGRGAEAVLAALVHDAGMLRVPESILGTPGPLDEVQRRLVQGHAAQGAELAARLWPNHGWPVEACADHHERMDGTGYPQGKREIQIAPFSRLMAACDVYAALCVSRPHRPALEPRTALTETLLLADRGALDRFQAERLLLLSFYPVGSVVELNDGAVGVVMATHAGQLGLAQPARPILHLWTDSQKMPLPLPQRLDLAECPPRSILRLVPPGDRHDLLGRQFPELV